MSDLPGSCGAIGHALHMELHMQLSEADDKKYRSP